MSENKDDSSLGLIDLLTNASGAMLVLLVLASVLQTTLAWGVNQSKQEDQNRTGTLILVRSVGVGQIFDPASQHPVFRLNGDQDSFPVRGPKYDWGADYGIVVSEGLLPENITIEVRTKRKADLEISIYSVITNSSESIAVSAQRDEWTRIWPVSDSRRPVNK